MFKRIDYDNEKDWLAIRGKGIGGSDASSIVGANPYKSNVDLWKHKCGLSEDISIDNTFTRYGKNVEDAVRTIFQSDFIDDLKVYHTNEVLYRVDKEFLRASLDGEIEVLNDLEITSYYKETKKNGEVEHPKKITLKKGWKGVYEGKTSFMVSSTAREKWNYDGVIPQNYYVQVLHYLLVTDYDFVILSAMLNYSDSNEVKTHEIRNYVILKENVKSDLEYLENAETEFWKCVETKTEPALLLAMY